MLRQRFPEAITFDLLLADQYRRCLQDPTVIRQELTQRGISRETQTAPVIIDEVQKAPQLLDEVHWMIEPCRLPGREASDRLLADGIPT